MKSFSYNSSTEQDNIETVLSYRKRRIAKQQVIFYLILIGIIASLSVYILHRMTYADFDGFVHVDITEHRAIDDILILRIYPSVGTIVQPGDTLYSYIYINQLVELENMNKEPAVVQHYRDTKLQAELARQELSVYKVKINELKRQIEMEEHDIRFGLAENSHKLNLERELKETEEKLKAQQNKVRILSDMRQAAYTNIQKLGNQTNFKDINPNLIRYFEARFTAIITNTQVADMNVVFKGETIMTANSTNIQASNLFIVTYIPVDKMKYIDLQSQVEVIVNKETSFAATVSMIGSRTEVLPEHLRSNFSRHIEVPVGILSINSGQRIPLWALSNRTPVTIRVRRYNNLKRDDNTQDLYYRYIEINDDGHSIIEEKSNM